MNTLEINCSVPQSASRGQLFEEIECIELSYERRHTERMQHLETIKSQIQQTHSGRKRTKQSIPLYLLSLALPISLSYLNAYILLELDVNVDVKGYLVITLICVGFIVSLLSNLTVGPWREIIKLYFLIDSLVPVMLAAWISLYALQNFMETGRWYSSGFTVVIPLWIIYFAGNIRVIIAYVNMTKWEVLLYKLSVLASGLMFFYVGFTFMRGAYKVTRGKLLAKEETFRNMIYLYVFGLCQLFFNLFKKLSQYDQTDQLKYVYQFQDAREQKQREIVEIQYQQLQKEVFKEDEQDAKYVKQISNKLLALKSTSVIFNSLQVYA